ncbi:hypothetical protein D3C73_690580 [compost metagenome]
MQRLKAVKQADVLRVRGSKATEFKVLSESKLMLQVGEPRRFDVQHQIGPGLVIDRVAGMHIARIHQHHRAGADFERRLLMDVGTAPRGDRTHGKVLVGMPAVANLAAVGNGAGFDEGQGVVAPEARGLVGIFGGGLHRRCPRQIRSAVYALHRQKSQRAAQVTVMDGMRIVVIMTLESVMLTTIRCGQFDLSQVKLLILWDYLFGTNGEIANVQLV